MIVAIGYWKLVGGSTLLCGLLTGAASFLVTPRYVSTASLRVESRGLDVPPGDVLSKMWENLVERRNLSEIIQRPTLNLYAGERARLPLEDVMDQMKKADLELEAPEGSSFQISFHYSDPQKALAVVEVLTQQAVREISAQGYPCQVVHNPNLPEWPESPVRSLFVAGGLGIGFMIGVIASSFRSRPVWSAKVFACGLAGAAVVGALSLLLPDRYQSGGMLHIEVPREQIAGGLSLEKAHDQILEEMQQAQDEILSNESLSEILQRPTIQIYSFDRHNPPLLSVIADMRKDIRIERPKGWSSAAWRTAMYRITFQYRDAQKTQAVAAALITKLQDALKRDRKWTIEIADTANLPEEPESPNRWVLAAAGLFAGVLMSSMTFSPAVGARHSLG